MSNNNPSPAHNHNIFEATPSGPNICLKRPKSKDELRRKLQVDIDAFLKNGGRIERYGIETKELIFNDLPMYVIADKKSNAYTGLRSSGIKDKRWSFLTKMSQLADIECMLVVVGNYRGSDKLASIVEKARSMPNVDVRIIYSSGPWDITYDKAI